MRFFARYFRCIAYNARGFPPSDVPGGRRALLAGACARRRDRCARPPQDRTRPCRRSFDGRLCGAARRHRLSAARPLASHRRLWLRRRARKKAKFQRRMRSRGRLVRSRLGRGGEEYALGPTRVQFQNKDPRGWAEFARQLGEHSPQGQALTMRGVQMKRPSLWELVEDMKRIDVPTLIVTGDEDDPCLEPGLLMKRSIADRWPRGASPFRAHHQHRGAGGLQPCSARVLPARGRRPRKPARSAFVRCGDPRFQEMILVTGGSGFVGLNVAEQLLARGDQVIIYDLYRPPAGFPGNFRFEMGTSRTASVLARFSRGTNRRA